MRPQILNQYRPSFLHRILLSSMKMLYGPTVIEVAKSAYYRPELLQRNYYRLQQKVLRGSSEWTVAERELFASFISSVENNCKFCIAAHAGIASAARSPKWVQSTLDNKEPDESRGKMGVILKFLKKLTQQPWTVTSGDIDSLRKQRLSDHTIEDAVLVCVIFSIGNRLADSLGIQVASSDAIELVAPLVIGMGYKLYSIQVWMRCVTQQQYQAAK